jgi:hypothetical protein
MLPELSTVAEFCTVGALNAQLVVAARRRSYRETADLIGYMESPEFAERVARLEPRVRAGITRGVPVPLKDIARELALPIDLVVSWLGKLGINPIVAIGGRANI